MRVIACGTGMPMPRLKRAAACFLVELGNGDKFIFDMGAGKTTLLNRILNGKHGLRVRSTLPAPSPQAFLRRRRTDLKIALARQ